MTKIFKSIFVSLVILTTLFIHPCLAFTVLPQYADLISVTSNNSHLEYSYDRADRLIASRTHAPQPETTISYKYDLNGNRTKLTYNR